MDSIVYNEDVMDILVTAGRDIEFQYQNGYTILRLAIFNGKIEIVRFLLEAGAKPVGLVDAAMYGNIKMVKMLLDAGSEPVGLVEASSYGHIKVVKMLLDCRINTSKLLLDRSLREASRYGHIDVAKLLIDSGADPCDKTSLDLAQEYGHTEIVKLLLKMSLLDSIQSAIPNSEF